jgi:hypothetical protein
MGPRIVTVAAGEEIQLNGPWWGLRVFAMAAGAAFQIGGEGWVDALPIALPAHPDHPWDRVRLRGPLTVQLADSPEAIDALSDSSPVPAEPPGLLEVMIRGPGGNPSPVYSQILPKPEWANAFSLFIYAGSRMVKVLSRRADGSEETIYGPSSNINPTLVVVALGFPHTDWPGGGYSLMVGKQRSTLPPGLAAIRVEIDSEYRAWVAELRATWARVEK